GSERGPRLVDFDDRVNRVVLAVELGLGEPRLRAELPEAVAVRMEEEVAGNLEVKLHRRVRRNRQRQPDDQTVLRVMKRELLPVRVGDLVDVIVLRLRTRVPHAAVQIEVERALRGPARDDRLIDAQLCRLVEVPDERVVDRGEQEWGIDEIGPPAADRLLR